MSPSLKFLFFFFFDDLICGMCCKLDLDLKSFTGTAFRQQIFYRNGAPDSSGLLSPLTVGLCECMYRCGVRASRNVTGPDLGVSQAVNKPHTKFFVGWLSVFVTQETRGWANFVPRRYKFRYSTLYFPFHLLAQVQSSTIIHNINFSQHNSI